MHGPPTVLETIRRTVSKALGHDVIDLTLDDVQSDEEVDDEVFEVIDDPGDDGM